MVRPYTVGWAASRGCVVCCVLCNIIGTGTGVRALALGALAGSERAISRMLIGGLLMSMPTPPPFPAGAAGLGALGLCSPRHLGDGKAPCICSICLGSRQRNVRREVLVLQKAPLSSQAASHLSVGDGDGVHPWYMMLRRFSSRSARKWANLAARVKKVVAVLGIW